MPTREREPAGDGGTDGDGDNGADGPGGAEPTAAGKRSARSRSSSTSPGPARAPGTRGRTSVGGRPSFSTKWAIDRLDEREKRYSLVGAVAAAAFAVAIYLDETNNKKFRLAKGQLTPQATLVVGLICAGLLLGAALLGRRAPVGFVALFTGASFSSSFFFLGLPFFVLAVWLLYRSYKVQRDANVAATAAAGARTAAAARSSGPSPARASRAAPARSGGSRKRGATGPQANKRFTPKRPPPPKPKPSRRERNASANPGQS